MSSDFWKDAGSGGPNKECAFVPRRRCEMVQKKGCVPQETPKRRRRRRRRLRAKRSAPEEKRDSDSDSDSAAAASDDFFGPHSHHSLFGEFNDYWDEDCEKVPLLKKYYCKTNVAIIDLFQNCYSKPIRQKIPVKNCGFTWKPHCREVQVTRAHKVPRHRDVEICKLPRWKRKRRRRSTKQV